MIHALRVLAFVQVFLAFFTALVGSFADGGQWWERFVLVAVHPAAAVFLLILVVHRSARVLALVTTVLLALNIAADAGLALAIGSGAIKGDWWLPLVFAVVPLIALPYCILRSRNS